MLFAAKTELRRRNQVLRDLRNLKIAGAAHLGFPGKRREHQNRGQNKPKMCFHNQMSILQLIYAWSVVFRDSRKYSIVFLIPSSKLTRGSQLRTFFARVMSGWRTFGSSTGNGLCSIVDFAPVIRMISSANCLMVISRGLPRLTGSWKSLIAGLKIPSIKSER